MHILKIVSNGDCGLDVMCLMLGWARSLANRTLIRNELAQLALDRGANRALILMLFQTGELTVHLGQINIASAGASLLSGPSHELVSALPKLSH